MKKILSIILSLSLISTNLAYANDDRFLAGIKFNSQGHNFYLEYQNHEDQFENWRGNNEDNLNLALKLDSKSFKTLEQDYMSYTGYKNVEGFKNNKRKDDWTFASLFVGAGLIVVAAGALTVAAIVSAID